MARLTTNSRYFHTPIINIDGNDTVGLWTAPNWIKNLKSIDFQVYKVDSETEGRPDKISFELYNFSNLMWILLAVNKPLDPMNWPKAGSIIYAPKRTIVIANI